MKFKSRSPGKIIIIGEHFVVHGSYALAAAINRGTTAQVTFSDRSIIISKNLGLKTNLVGRIPRTLSPIVEVFKSTLNYLDEKRGIRLELESDIPISAGLGSSASASVAVVSAVSTILGHTLTEKEVIDLSMISEKLIHVNPSGIDPTISTCGGVILFKKGVSYESVNLGESISLIIGYSGTSRNTSRMIELFSKAKLNSPYSFEALVTSTSLLSKLTASALASKDLDTVASILNYNHKILSSIGVSSLLIDNLVESSLASGCLAAKLTGGGGGGCIIALPPERKSNSINNKIKRFFTESWVSTIPNPGVLTWMVND
ncbi:MAG TPA: mevalonate kinase [Nitrososphaerales archaeon]